MSKFLRTKKISEICGYTTKGGGDIIYGELLEWLFSCPIFRMDKTQRFPEKLIIILHIMKEKGDKDD